MIGDSRDVYGYITLDKFLVGRGMAEVERNLGFHAGRLSRGAAFIKLMRLPALTEFDLAAYSITAQHQYTAPTGYDLDKLKAIAASQWNLSGGNRLVKVIPVIGHDATMRDEDQYPVGAGVPQWRLVTKTGIPGIVVAETHTGADVYRPAC